MEHAEEFFEKIQKLPLEVVSDFVFVRFGLSKAVFHKPETRWTEATQYFDDVRKVVAGLGSDYNPSDAIMHRICYEWILCKQNRIEEANPLIRETKEMAQKASKYFENTLMQTILLVPRQVEIGKQFTLRIHIINVSKQSIQLSSIEGLNLVGLDIETMPDYCSLQRTCINMNGKKLDAFQVELFKITRATKRTRFSSLSKIDLH